jgi:hypothetical protein
MTSARKIKANRANARASTGAKTAHGKARAAQNARRHGLSLSVLENPVLSVEAENLARVIAGEGATPEIHNLARRVAEPQIDLMRIRQVRHDLLSRDLNDPEFRPRKWDKDMKAITNIAFTFIRRCGPDAVLPPLVAEHADRVLHWKPQGAEKLAYIVSDLAPKLAALDRYERRALSRRKFAIRALDTTRAKATALGSIP